MHQRFVYTALFVAAMASATIVPLNSQAADSKQPNIIVIMGDDIGWSNIGVYNQGMMAGRTPHLDTLANEGMRFTDYYAEASCTAGLAAVGLAFGLVVTWLIDLAIGGPGLGVMVGL